MEFKRINNNSDNVEVMGNCPSKDQVCRLCDFPKDNCAKCDSWADYCIKFDTH